MDGWPTRTGYDHRLPPNSFISDCARVGPIRELWKAARSRHPGGVNTTMADGSVQFIAGDVNWDLYQALGTRDRGESVELP